MVYHCLVNRVSGLRVFIPVQRVVLREMQQGNGVVYWVAVFSNQVVVQHYIYQSSTGYRGVKPSEGLV